MKISIESSNVVISIESNKTENTRPSDVKVITMEKTNLSKSSINVEPIEIKASKDNKIYLTKSKDTDIVFDIDKFIDLYRWFFDKESEYDKSIKVFSKQESKDSCWDLLKNKNLNVYCIFDKGSDIIGCIVFRNKPYFNKPDDTNIDDNAFMIRMLFIDPKYHRKGYATELLKFAENIAISKKKDKLILNVISGNINAYNLYKKCGFKEIKHK